MIMSPIRFAVVLPLALPLFAGCLLGEMKQMNDNIKAMDAQGMANAKAALANAHTDQYVVSEHAWLCGTAEQATAKAVCPGGQEFAHNRIVTTIGQDPQNGTWPVALYDAQGEHRLYVAADAVNELPDLRGLEAFATDVQQRYPETKRIPLRAISFANLIEQPQAFKGRVLVVRQPLGGMSNEDYGVGQFTFTLPIPVTTGSKWSALAQFELHNGTISTEFHKGARSYSCGGKYCDNFVIVAELTGKTVDRVDEFGGVHRLPVFAVRELADRFGTYRSE
jgi:hypothetical protein